MASPTDWVPMFWPCGILEALRRGEAKEGSPTIRETLEKWQDPGMLSILAGSPINCLVLPWAAGRPEDSRHQHDLIPLIGACRGLGISVVGKVDSSADLSTAADSARFAGLSALATERISDNAPSLPVIPCEGRSRIPWASGDKVVALTKAVWPGIRGNYDSPEAAAEAGPTPYPWIDSNGWLIQLARAEGPQKTIWMMVDPGGKTQPLRSESYVLAVTDSAVFGARWVVSLDDHLRAGLIEKAPSAMESWKKLLQALVFFEDRRRWQSFVVGAALGVLSDFSGGNEFLSEEVLNLASRRQFSFRIILKTQYPSESLEQLKAILYIDQQGPEKELRQRLLDFVEAGGLLIALPSWGKVEGALPSDVLDGRFTLYRLGRGRLVMAKNLPEDPYALAADVQLLVSHRNDLLRIYNGVAIASLYTLAPRAGSSLVQLIDYSGWDSSQAVTLWMRKPMDSGNFWSLRSDRFVRLPGTRVGGGVEFHLPRFSIYGAIEEDSSSGAGP